jgi:hypothetical protein
MAGAEAKVEHLPKVRIRWVAVAAVAAEEVAEAACLLLSCC